MCKIMWVMFLGLWVVGCTQQVDNTITEDDMGDVGAQRGNQQSPSGGWSKTAEMLARDTAKTQSMQVSFPSAGDYTVQFGTPSIPSVRVEADITWTVEGNSTQRTVSVGDGVSVTGTGAAVKVLLRDVTTNATSSPAAETPYTVGILVAPGVRANTQKPPTLVPVPSAVIVAGGGAATVDVPLKAGVVSIYVGMIGQATTPILSGDAVIQMFLGENADLIQAFDPVLTEGFIPVPPGTRSVTFENNSGTGIRFSFQWGIDG